MRSPAPRALSRPATGEKAAGGPRSGAEARGIGHRLRAGAAAAVAGNPATVSAVIHGRAGAPRAQFFELVSEGDPGPLERSLLNGNHTAQEPLFRALATSAPVGIYEIDPDGQFVFVNEQWCALVGVAAEEALGRAWDHFIDPDDRARVVAEWEAAVDAGREFAIEYRYRRPDGREVWIDGRAVAVSDPDGEPLAFLGSVVDVTERRASERAARALAAIVDSSAEAIISIDLDGIVRTWNPGAERVFGYLAAEMAGCSIEVLVPPDRTSELPELLDKVRRGERVENFETVRIDKEFRPIDVALTVSPIRDAEGAVAGVAGILRDISSQKAAERQLVTERRQLADAQQIARVGSWEIDAASGRWTWSAQQFRNHGFDPDAAVPSRERVLDRVHPDDREEFERRLDELEAEPEEFSVEYRIVLPDSQVRTLEVHGRTLEGSSGLMGTSRDVTAERDAERLKDEFLGLISHELRTPLTSIIGYTELLAEVDATNLSREGRRFLEVIDRNSRRELGLVGDLLLLTRITAGGFEVEFRRLDVSELAAASVDGARPAAAKAGLELEAEIAPGVIADGDQHRIAQVLENLISNAIKFTPAGGRVTVRLFATDAAAVFEVTDTGIGIEAQDLGRLFDRTYRAEEAERRHIPGTGLGLTIVKAIVDAHEARIAVESQPGEGTTVRIELPTRARAPGGPTVDG
ncbi:MAG: PAS domain S-box protein [Solirubrobacterales bacterium]|nr:PAS domain S-box protein [Solirubrobacterales bacterium]